MSFYHRVNTSVGGLLVPEGIIRPVVDFSTVVGGVPEGFYQCFYHWVNTSVGGLLVPQSQVSWVAQ